MAIFWGRFFGSGLVFYARDLGFFFTPLRAAFGAAIRSGASPFWNPTLGSGIPMAADPNAAVFFPATLLFLVQPLSAAARLAHLFWAAAFPLLAFASLRRLSLSRFPAAVCALALAFSGPAMTLASLPTTAWAVAFFLPLLAAASAASGRVRAAATGLTFGLAVAAGEPAIAGEILALGIVFFVLERRGGGRAAAAGVGAGALIALPQIVGAAELIGETVRRGGLPVSSGAAFYSVRPLRFLAVAWPGLFGDVHSPAGAGFWGNAFFDAGTPYISTLAVGTAILVLLPAGARDRRGRSFLALAALAALLSLGRYLPGGARLLELPGLSLVRYPEKWLFFASISAVAAAGFGLERILAGDAPARRRLAVAAAVVSAASAVGWAWLRLAPDSAWWALLDARVVDARVAFARAGILDAIGRELAAAAAFGAVLLLAAAGFRDRPRRLSAAVVALLFLDLVPRTWNSVPLAPAARFDVAPDAVRAVASRGGRLFFDGETEVAEDPLRPMTPAMWGVPFAGNNDIDRFSPRRSFLFGRLLASLPFSDPRKAWLLRLADVRSVSSVDPSAASVLVPWFSTSPRRTVYRLSGGARFRFAGSAEPAPGEEDARVRLLAPGRDPLSSPPIVEGAASTAGASTVAPARIRVIARRADREEVALENPAPGWLLRSETFDPHWKARIDGHPAAVVAADFAFQAVRVPPGSHRVVFTYSDPAAAAAMLVSLAVLFACGVALRPAKSRR